MPDSSPLHERTEPPLPVKHHMNYHHMNHHTSTPSTDNSFHVATAEHFPTTPLDDIIWLEGPNSR